MAFEKLANVKIGEALGSSADGTNSGITLLGASETLKGTPDVNENYSSGWTTEAGSTVTINSNHVKSNNSPTNADHRVSKALGVTLNNSKWTLRCAFDWSSNTSSTLPLALTSSTGNMHTSNHDAIGLFMDSGNLSTWYKDGSGNYTAGSTQSTSSGTQYYVELARIDATTVTMKIFTDSSFSTQHGSTKTQTIPSSVQGLTTLQHGTWTTAGGTSGQTWEISDTKIYNNSINFSGGAKLGTGAYYFNGSDSTKPNVKISDIDLFSGATKEYTLSFWLKADFAHDSSSDNRCIFDFSGSNQIQFFKHPTANWKLNFDSGSDLTLSGGTEAVPDDGAFHHICVTRNSSSLYTVYVDGVSKGTITQTLNVNSGSALNFYLGSYDSVDQEFWKGWIDDVGIWSRVLTATEIGKLANNNASAGAGFNSADTSANNVSGGKFSFNMLRNGSHDGVHWDLADDSSHSNNITSTDATSDTQWVLRAKIKFSAVSGGSSNGNYMWLGLAKNYHSFTANDTIDTTIMCQFHMDATSYYRTNDTNGSTSLASQLNSGDNSQSWSPATDTDYYLDIRRTSATAYSISVYTGSDFSTGNVGTITGSCPSGLADLRYIKLLNYYNSSGGRTFTGEINWFKFYDGTNSPSSGTLTKEYTFTDGDAQLVSSLSDKSNLKAHYSMDTEISGGGYADFNGSSSYSSIGGSASDWKFLSDGSAWTVSFWFNDDSSSQNSRFFNTMNDNSGSNRGFSLTHDGTAIGLGIYDGTASAGYPFSTNTSNAFSDTGAWHMYTFAYDGGNTANTSKVRFYKDGSLTNTITQSRAMSSNDPNHSPLMGKRTDNQRYVDGKLQQFLIYKRELSASDVTALYNSGTVPTSPSTTNLYAWWKFADNMNDSGSGGNNGDTNNITFSTNPSTCPNDDIIEEGELIPAKTLSTGTFSAKKHLMIQMNVNPSGNASNYIRFNGDETNKYCFRRAEDGGSDNTSLVNKSGVYWERDYTEQGFATIDLLNISSKEKLGIMNSMTHNGDGSGSSNVPKRGEIVFKWTGTDQITKIELVNVGQTGNYGEGTEIAVYGTD